METINHEQLLDTPLGKLVAKHPSWSRVLEANHLDYCCQGATSLRSACLEAKLDPHQILNDMLNSNTTSDDIDWTTCSLEKLIAHILESHHAYLNSELPRIETLLEKVVRAHAERFPEVVQIRTVFARMAAELRSHMMKEEQILFPAITRMEHDPTAQFGFGRFENPISMMEHEHEEAGAALDRIRELTHQYTPPAGTCPTHRALYDALETLEKDMHQHVHKENNILFPAAKEIEDTAIREDSAEYTLD